MKAKIKDGYVIGYEEDGTSEINIPEGIIGIGANAFEGCQLLREIDLPNTIKYIGELAFARSALRNIEIPDSVIEIRGKAFEGCQYLSKVILPKNIDKLAECLFQNCSALGIIEIPNSVTMIEDFAFRFSGLKSVTIPDNVEKIGRNVFGICKNLVSVKLSEKLCDITDSMFSSCENLRNVDIPNSIISIGNHAFYRCLRLYTIDLPRQLRIIGVEAFAKCDSLKNIVLPSGIEEIGVRAFDDCTGLTFIDIPDSIKEIRDGIFSGCNNLVVNLPDNLNAKIGYSAFTSCKEIRFKAYNVFKQLSEIDKCAGCINIIRNHLQDKTYYSEEELDDFREFIFKNRDFVFEYALINPEILRFIFEEIESVYTIDETRELAVKYCNSYPAVSAYLLTYLHSKLESMGTTETDYTQTNDELTLDDYTPEELEQMKNNNDDEDEMKQNL